MDEAMHKAISAVALDKGKALQTWLVNHPDTPTPWVGALHEKFMAATADISRAECRRRLQHRDGARSFAQLILAKLGSKDELKNHTQEIAADLKRYLIWLGCAHVHELIIGGVEPRPSRLRSDCETGYATATSFRQALHQVLHHHYYVTADKFAPDEHLGALIVSLATDGVLNLPELKMAIDQIVEGRLFVVAPHLRHVAGPIGNGDAHFRRIGFDDVTFGLACSLPRHQLAPITTAYLTTCLQAFAKLSLPREHHRISLRGLFRAFGAYYRLQPEMPHLLVDYMEGDIVSSSLIESRYAQLFGKRPFPEVGNDDEEPKKPPRMVRDFDRPTIINDIKKCLALRPEKLARQETLIKISFLRNHQTLKPAILLLLDWVEWILTVKGDRPSYALMSLTNLAQHLLPQLRNLDTRISTPDDWRELIDAMTTGLPPTHKVFDAIRLMTIYLKSISADNYEDAGRNQKSRVNARVITPHEIDQAVAILKVRLTPARFRLAESLIRLAYALGCRRWELLGLQHRDIVGNEDPVLYIRDNAIRTTKTVSSNRCNSLQLCSDLPFYAGFRKQLAEAPDAQGDQSIFQSVYFDIEKDHKALFITINKALQTACRDPDVSFHTLRHSAVCQSLLSVFWHEMPVDHLLDYPYFRDIDARANRIRAILVQPHLVNCFEHEAISQQVGHLSFATTAESYFHFFDLLRHAYLHKINFLTSEHDHAKLALSAAGFTRYSRTIRDQASLKDDHYLTLIVQVHAKHLQIYDDEEPTTTNDTMATDSDLYRSLLATRDQMLHLHKNEDPTANEPTSSAASPDHAPHISPQQLAIIEHLYTKKINRTSGFIAFASKEPDYIDRRCRMIMAARAELLMARLMPSEKAEFANGLIDALSHSAIQKHGHFRFRTLDDAERAMTSLSRLLTDGPVQYAVVTEHSIKSDGKVKKAFSPEVFVSSLADISKATRGSLLVGLATEHQADLAWYRFRSLVWVCCLIYLRFGTLEPLPTGEAL